MGPLCSRSHAPRQPNRARGFWYYGPTIATSPAGSQAGASGAGAPPPGRNLLRSGLIVFGGYSLQLVTLAVTIPLLIRILGIERYGLFNIVGVIVIYFGFCDVGLGRATVRYASEALGRGSRADVGDIFWTGLWIAALVGAGVGLLLALASPVIASSILEISPDLRDEAVGALGWGAVSAACWVVIPTLGGVLESHGRFGWLGTVRTSAVILTPILAWALGREGARLSTIMTVVAAKDVLATVAFGAVAAALVPEIRGLRPADRRLARRMLGYGAWTSILVAAPLLFGTIDRLIVAAGAGMSQAAAYAVPQQLVHAFMMGTYAATLVLSPSLTRLSVADPVRMGVLFRCSTDLVLLAMIPIGGTVMLFADEILRLWLGRVPEGAASVMRILGAGLILGSIRHLLMTLLGATRFVAAASVMTAGLVAVQAVATLLLVGPFGLVGAASASLAVQALAVAIPAVFVRRSKVMPSGPLFSGRALLLAGGALAAVGLGLLAKRSGAETPVVLGYSLSIAAYVAVAWLWALPKEIKTGFAALLGRLPSPPPNSR